MRSRLHHKFFAEILMLDAVHTRADDPDAGGPLVSGYDDDFDEILVFTTPTGQREEARVDQPPLFVPCNVASTAWEGLQEMMAGNSPTSRVELIVHRKDLEAMELMNTETGEAIVRPSDKLVSLRDECMHYVYKFRAPLFVVGVAPSFGIGTTPDLFTLSIDNRDTFVRA